MPEWISGSYQILTSGSFEITRPAEIPLHTWTSSWGNLNHDGTSHIMQDNFNSGDYIKVVPYLTLLLEETGSPMYPSQSHVDEWAQAVSASGYDVSQSFLEWHHTGSY